MSIEQERQMTTEAVQQEIRHIHNLLALRDLLADRGVAAQELRRYDAAIAAARDRLAALARTDAVELAA
jgi:DNA-binding protein H-NS